MAAALSIISLVIFFAPCACACAHSTPGNSVPASPIPEQVFMKFRRSSMVLPPLNPSSGAYDITPTPSSNVAASLFRMRKAEGVSQAAKMLYDAGVLKGVSMARFAKLFVFLTGLLLTFTLRHTQTAMAGNPVAEGKEVALKSVDITSKLFPERVFFRG